MCFVNTVFPVIFFTLYLNVFACVCEEEEKNTVTNSFYFTWIPSEL